MRRMMILGLAGLVSLILLVPSLSARVVFAPLPLPERVALTECVVIGTVGKVEDKNVSAVPSPGAKNKVEFQVFDLKIDDALQGAKGLKNLRIGFVPAPGGVRPRPGMSLQLAMGQEGCFFLTKHCEESFYVDQTGFDFLNKKAPTYEKEIALIKRCTKLLDDANASLKSKDTDDRLLTAAMLITRYRTNRQPNVKTEPIAAEQSKLILEALAEADWTKADDPNLRGYTPLMYFQRLGLTDKDGWKLPMKPDPKTGRDMVDYKEIPTVAKKWCKDNAGSYRIQRFVNEKADK